MTDDATNAPVAVDGTEAAVDPRLQVHEAIAPENMAELLRARGFRAELTVDQTGAPMIRSASSGLLYHVRFGNPAPQGERLYLDVSYIFLAQVDGRSPEELAAEWNAGKRFARLHAHDRVVALEMDVLLAGGVSTAHLLATLEIWDRLMQDLASIVRQAAPQPETNQTGSAL